MDAKSNYRDRADTDVAVLDALVDNRDDGLTIFELRASVDASIDDIETSLATLKSDDLIRVTNTDGETRIYPHDRVIPADETEQRSLTDVVREKLPF